MPFSVAARLRPVDLGLFGWREVQYVCVVGNGAESPYRHKGYGRLRATAFWPPSTGSVPL